ncbi:SAM-dependent methyltransferase [Micromonospora sp. WMMD987]|jgi:SAM-dependent MidA family methyltransferase|uniref:SAM-dependent methyltransferase n=1 Tax=Micromonospora TaxID=1873 RepID=UPI00249B2F73|nr:SAM-dependent methyltransferase [Micromonospora sp. WMMD987]WFE98355.1 SAM-dependent methyltransferase [Micromonospora sp. WMMD987]
MRWRDAMAAALYGPGGFFVSGAGPADHFRTSVHATPAFAAAVFRLVSRLDATLGFPTPFDVVDVGAGRGELLHTLTTLAHTGPAGPAPVPLARRLRLTAVELAPRPPALPAHIAWTTTLPDAVTGLLVATEWLDNVPLDLAAPAPTSPGATTSNHRYLLVDPGTGVESAGPPLTVEDATWLTRWWPDPPGHPSAAGTPDDADLPVGRIEIGRSRDEAWAQAVRRVARGVALAVDYGHLRQARPFDGTLTGYRGGRQVPPVPDGSCDITAHVAVDSVAAAGAGVAGCAYTLVSQREALRALGADGGRPPLGLAGTDPAGYLRALAAASAVAELTDPAGLGGHHWLLQPVGVAVDPLMAR